MKIRIQEYRRRGLVPLAALALAAYYFFVFLPLGRRAESRDAPLQEAWQDLYSLLERTNVGTVDFRQLTNQLSETRQALITLANAKQQATVRLQLAQPVRDRMNAAFQLVEYQNERSKELDELGNLAKQQQVTVAPTVFAGFPEHTADTKQPALLWASLALMDGLFRTAVQCKVTAIHSLEMPLALTNAPATNETERLAEIPLQLEFTAPVTSATRLLQCLPLRAEEIRAAGLPEAPTDKPVLFVDRLLMKKQSPDKPDEVRVSLRVSGFVLRE
jgi:hypothetical protein